MLNGVHCMHNIKHHTKTNDNKLPVLVCVCRTLIAFRNHMRLINRACDYVPFQCFPHRKQSICLWYDFASILSKHCSLDLECADEFKFYSILEFTIKKVVPNECVRMASVWSILLIFSCFFSFKFISRSAFVFYGSFRFNFIFIASPCHIQLTIIIFPIGRQANEMLSKMIVNMMCSKYGLDVCVSVRFRSIVVADFDRESRSEVKTTNTVEYERRWQNEIET